MSRCAPCGAMLSQPPLQRGKHRRALQPRDRAGGIKMLRAVFAAALLAVAGMAAGITGHRFKTLLIAAVTHVVDQRPGAVERGRAEIVGIPRDDVAARVADGAADALDAGVGGAARAALRRHRSELLGRVFLRDEFAARARPLV